MAMQVTITIESSSVLMLSTRTSGHVWCQGCRTEVEVLQLGPRNQMEDSARAVLQELIRLQ
jgi:hypothetical protein